MGLSNSLEKTAIWLIKRRVSKVRVHYSNRVEENQIYRIVTIHCILEDRCPIQATGLGSTRLNAFAKAISELGEVILKVESSLLHRSGMAGGFCIRNAMQRAKFETLERDAFFFITGHWFRLRGVRSFFLKIQKK